MDQSIWMHKKIKIVKEIQKDNSYVLSQILEKKLQEVFLKKDLKCGNIFMHLEEILIKIIE